VYVLFSSLYKHHRTRKIKFIGYTLFLLHIIIVLATSVCVCPRKKEKTYLLEINVIGYVLYGVA